MASGSGTIAQQLQDEEEEAGGVAKLHVAIQHLRGEGGRKRTSNNDLNFSQNACD